VEQLVRSLQTAVAAARIEQISQGRAAAVEHERAGVAHADLAASDDGQRSAARSNKHPEIVGRELVEQGHAVGDAAVIDLAAILVESQVELGQQGFGIAGLRAAQQRRSTAKDHRQQDADDGDDHQHFRQGKTSAATTAPRQSHSPCMSRHRLIHHFVQFTTSSCVPNKRSGPAEINRQSSGLTGRSIATGSVSSGPIRGEAFSSRMNPSNAPSAPKSACWK
jgi:hypothetical protein